MELSKNSRLQHQVPSAKPDSKFLRCTFPPEDRAQNSEDSRPTLLLISPKPSANKAIFNWPFISIYQAAWPGKYKDKAIYRKAYNTFLKSLTNYYRRKL